MSRRYKHSQTGSGPCVLFSTVLLLAILSWVVTREDEESFVQDCAWGPAAWCSSDQSTRQCKSESFCASASSSVKAHAPNQIQRLQNGEWFAAHENLKRAAANAVGAKVLFLGDSITETWRGTDGGGDCPRCKGVPEVFARKFGHLNPLALSIGGDETQHLIWRMTHGELEGLDPKVVVLLIGTNNLGKSNMTAEEVCTGIQATIQYLRARFPEDGTDILVLALLPRGEPFGDGRRIVEQPGRFTQRILSINTCLKGYCSQHQGLAYEDCGHHFLSKDGRQIIQELMPDLLHPSAQGHALMADCILPHLHVKDLPN